MDLVLPELEMPELHFQYVKRDQKKYLRILSDKVDKLLIDQLSAGKIRMQIWLEREVKKGCGNGVKRSWVHSRDNSNMAPAKLFSELEYYYGGGNGWGWATILPPGEFPNYSTTNGYVPTEFEVTAADFINFKICKEIPILDIFSNILKHRSESTYAITGTRTALLAILGRNKTTSQPLRVRLVINKDGKPVIGLPSSPLMLGIHDLHTLNFNASEINDFIKVSYYK